MDGAPARSDRPEDLPLHELTATPRLGNTVVELHGVTDGYGADDLLFTDLDLALDPRARLGIVGPNGAGKSTLLDVIAGRRTPRQGRVVHGSTARIGYYDQRGQDLPLDRRVREVVAGPARQPDWTDAALLERFWFQADAQWAPVRLLSGGERRRLQLVLVLRQAPNVLLLDEPTNDLDLDTLRALEDLLESWPGALVVVSHDRAFLERTVDDVLVLDGHGRASRHPDGFAAYEHQRRARRPGPRRAADRSRGPADRSGAAQDPTRGAPHRPKPRSPSTLRHQLKKAEAQLTKLRHRQSRLEEALTAATGTGQIAEIGQAGQELAAAQEDVARAEDAWLTLAEEAEAAGVPL